MMGGVSVGWRDLTRDSRTHLEWMNLYRRFDVISPWTVGRYHDEKTSDTFLHKYIIPDMEECEKGSIDYLLVVFPGFSFFHHKVKPFKQIPRLGGTFLWHQIYNALTIGNSSMIYIAMFDEVDEGTAIFKVAATQENAPVQATLLTHDVDGDTLPYNWYLRLAGEAATYLHEGIDFPAIITLSPTDVTSDEPTVATLTVATLTFSPTSPPSSPSSQPSVGSNRTPEQPFISGGVSLSTNLVASALLFLSVLSYM